ncbi:hypothetical protein [Desulforamulus ruminis]|uniref:hypothetical protein n=1 Tax=Desulforamulus ruminis TaxID=1564 RepID=UPI0016516FBE|nr:hypothetical protein [Desulforamulus ruminis]
MNDKSKTVHSVSPSSRFVNIPITAYALGEIFIILLVEEWQNIIDMATLKITKIKSEHLTRQRFCCKEEVCFSILVQQGV